jgi:hypothetical protein
MMGNQKTNRYQMMAQNNLPLKDKLKRLNRQLKFDGIQPQLELLRIHQPTQIQAIQSIADDVRGTSLEGLPFTIALLKSKLLSDQEIARELDIPVRAVRKFSQVEGFQMLMTRLSPAIWSDLILQAQATILRGLLSPDLREATELAKWLLERTGQVASDRPMNVHDHKTLVINGAGPGQAQPTALPGEVMRSPVEELAEAVMKRFESNSQKAKSAPPIRISES